MLAEERNFEGSARAVEPSASIEQEIERTWIPEGELSEFPVSLDAAERLEISQWYLSFPENDVREQRIRRTRFEDGSEVFERQYKSEGGEVRDETPPEVLSAEQVAALELENFARIDKTRYCLEAEGVLVQLDCYHGPYEGERKLEVEFSSVKQSKAFVAPAWFGREVTHDLSYRDSAKAARLEASMSDAQLPSAPVESLSAEIGLPLAIAEVERLLESEQRMIVVAVAGGSASGKTSHVAAKIAEHFGESHILSLDDYSKGNAFLAEAVASGRSDINWDHPEYIDSAAAVASIRAAVEEGETTFPKRVFDFKTGEPAVDGELHFKRVLVVEGLFALGEEVLGASDYSIFVDIGAHGRMMRRLMRDVTRTNMSADEILGYFLNTVHEAHEIHIQPTAALADLVIENEYNPSVEAARTGLIDQQLKFSGEMERAKLLSMGGQYLGAFEQKDTYFEPGDRDFAETGEMLRIRRNGADSWILAYKGPRESDGSRARLEAEIGKETASALQRVYSGQSFTISKTRETVLLNGVLISLDSEITSTRRGRVRRFEDTVELRSVNGSATTELEVVAKMLGLKMEEASTLSYAEMSE